jgi:MoaA/NifB/PqqE/SkfB family radical SAM enzyme
MNKPLLNREYNDFIRAAKNRKVVLYDTGNVESVINAVKDDVNIAYVMSDDFWKWNTQISGHSRLQYCSPHKLISDDDVVLITTPYYAFAVEKRLKNLGVKDYFCYGLFSENLQKSFKIGYETKNIQGRMFANNDTSNIVTALSNNCNLLCPFCAYRYKKNQKMPDMPIEQYVKLLDDCKGLWVHGKLIDTVSIDGSRELFVYPYYRQAVIETHKRRFNIHLVTNGTLLTSENSELLLENGLTKIIISVTGIRPQTYANYQGYNQRKDNVDFAARQLEMVIDNVKEFVRLRNEMHSQCAVAVSYLIDTDTVSEIKDAVAFWHEVGIDFFFGKAVNHISDDGEIVEKRTNSVEPAPSGLCYHLAVSANGELHPCCGQGPGEKIILGNVFETPLSEIACSDLFNEFYENLALRDTKKMHPVCALCPSSGIGREK